MSDDIDLEFDLDDGLDLPDIGDDGGLDDFGELDSEQDRSPASHIAEGALSGIQSTLVDPSMHRTVINNALPRGYVDAYDAVSTGVGTVKELYDTAAKTVGPAILPLKKASKRFGAKYKDKLPKWISDRLENLDTDVWKNKELSAEQQANIEIESQLGNIFRTSVESAEDAKQEAGLDRHIANVANANQLSLLGETVNELRKSTAYRDTIGTDYRKKMLELNFKQFFALRDTLALNKPFQETSLKYLEGIQKNSALPEYVKIRKTEVVGEMLRDKLLGGVADKVSDVAGGMRDKLVDNLKTKAKNAAESFKDGLLNGVDFANDHLDGVDDDDGPNKGFLGGMLAGNMGSAGALGYLSKALGGRLANNETIKKHSKDLEYLAEGGIHLIRDKLEELTNAPDPSEVNIDDNPDLSDVENEERRTMFEKVKGLFVNDGGLIGRLQSKLTKGIANAVLEAIPKGEAGYSIEEDGIAGMAERAGLYSDHTDRAIRLEIPRLLSEILKVETEALTGQQAGRQRFDYASGQLVDDETFKARIDDHAVSTADKENVNLQLEKLMEQIVNNTAMSAEEKGALRTLVLNDAMSGRIFNVKRYLRRVEEDGAVTHDGLSRIENETTRKNVRAGLEAFQEEIDSNAEGAKEARNEAQRVSKKLLDAVPNYKEKYRNVAAVYGAETLNESGAMKRVAYNGLGKQTHTLDVQALIGKLDGDAAPSIPTPTPVIPPVNPDVPPVTESGATTGLTSPSPASRGRRITLPTRGLANRAEKRDVSGITLANPLSAPPRKLSLSTTIARSPKFTAPSKAARGVDPVLIGSSRPAPPTGSDLIPSNALGGSSSISDTIIEHSPLSRLDELIAASKTTTESVDKIPGAIDKLPKFLEGMKGKLSSALDTTKKKSGQFVEKHKDNKFVTRAMVIAADAKAEYDIVGAKGLLDKGVAHTVTKTTDVINATKRGIQTFDEAAVRYKNMTDDERQAYRNELKARIANKASVAKSKFDDLASDENTTLGKVHAAGKKVKDDVQSTGLYKSGEEHVSKIKNEIKASDAVSYVNELLVTMDGTLDKAGLEALAGKLKEDFADTNVGKLMNDSVYRSEQYAQAKAKMKDHAETAILHGMEVNDYIDAKGLPAVEAIKSAPEALANTEAGKKVVGSYKSFETEVTKQIDKVKQTEIYQNGEKAYNQKVESFQRTLSEHPTYIKMTKTFNALSEDDRNAFQQLKDRAIKMAKETGESVPIVHLTKRLEEVRNGDFDGVRKDVVDVYDKGEQSVKAIYGNRGELKSKINQTTQEMTQKANRAIDQADEKLGLKGVLKKKRDKLTNVIKNDFSDVEGAKALSTTITSSVTGMFSSLSSLFGKREDGVGASELTALVATDVPFDQSIENTDRIVEGLSKVENKVSSTFGGMMKGLGSTIGGTAKGLLGGGGALLGGVSIGGLIGGGKLLGGVSSGIGSSMKVTKDLAAGGLGATGGFLGRAAKAINPFSKDVLQTHEGYDEALTMNAQFDQGMDVDVMDIYVKGEPTPRLYAWMIKDGKYFDTASGDVIKSIDDIKGSVSNQHGVILTEDDIALGLINGKNGKPILSGLRNVIGSVKGMGTAGALLKYSTLGLRLIGKSAGLLLGKKKVMDVYVKGERKARILAIGLTGGWYADADTGMPITEVSQLKGQAIVNVRTNKTMITEDDYETGLVGLNGKEINTSVAGRTFKKAKGLLGSVIGAVKDKAIAVKDAMSGFVKRGLNVRSTNNPVESSLGSLDVTSLVQRSQGDAQIALLEAIRDNTSGKQRVAGDTDGDGFREGGWRDRIYGKKEPKKEKVKRIKKEKKEGGILSLLKGALPAIMGIGGAVVGGLVSLGGTILGGLATLATSLLTGKMFGGGNGVPDIDGGDYDKDDKRKKGKDGKPSKSRRTPKAKGFLGKALSVGAGLAGAVGLGGMFGGGDDQTAAAEAPMNQSSGTKEQLTSEGADLAERPDKPSKPKQPAKKLSWWEKAKNVAKKGAKFVGKHSKSIGRVAMHGARMALPYVATAASSVASGVAAAAGTVVSVVGAPVIAAVAIVAAVVIGGYLVYNAFFAKVKGGVNAVRFAGYGIDSGDDDQKDKVTAIIGLEKEMEKKASINGLSAQLNDVKLESIYEGFGVDKNDAEAVETFNGWFANRFRPVFLKHFHAARSLGHTGTLTEIPDKMLIANQIKYIENTECLGENLPYDHDVAPWVGEDDLLSGGYVGRAHSRMLRELRSKRDELKNTPAPELTEDKKAEAVAVATAVGATATMTPKKKRVRRMSGGNPTSGLSSDKATVKTEAVKSNHLVALSTASTVDLWEDATGDIDKVEESTETLTKVDIDDSLENVSKNEELKEAAQPLTMARHADAELQVTNQYLKSMEHTARGTYGENVRQTALLKHIADSLERQRKWFDFQTETIKPQSKVGKLMDDVGDTVTDVLDDIVSFFDSDDRNTPSEPSKDRSGTAPKAGKDPLQNREGGDNTTPALTYD